MHRACRPLPTPNFRYRSHLLPTALHGHHFPQDQSDFKGLIPIFPTHSAAGRLQPCSLLIKHCGPLLKPLPHYCCALGVCTFALTSVPHPLLLTDSSLPAKIYPGRFVSVFIFIRTRTIQIELWAPSIRTHTQIMLFYYICTREAGLTPSFQIGFGGWATGLLCVFSFFSKCPSRQAVAFWWLT